MIVLLVIFGVSVISTIIGAIWYSPVLFGATWLRLSGVTVQQIEKQKKEGVMKKYLINLVATVVTVYVLSLLLSLTRATNIASAIILVILVWVGFVAMPMLNAVVWEKQRLSLYLLHSLHHLAALLVAAVLLISLL